ncbi:MAG TPA: FAD-dependent oxidoreductase [Sulfuricurvum sp.]|nr:FAD-dependent oxidoreductase [Sulfuricurvum sp.]HQT36434.1 FAD-dependent oxidoreductase [Sulfuricurvum sp.]
MKYDIIIIGAGINGCAIAREASKLGKRVAVIDKQTIGSGASSRSSRLIHGGLRYLEHGDFALVKEALYDRSRLIAAYPDLVVLRPFTLPVYAGVGRPWWIIKAGLYLYDLFSRFIAPHHVMSMEIFTSSFPALKTKGLRKIFTYYDAKTNDLLLTQTVAQEAQELGTVFFENTTLHEIKHHENTFELLCGDRHLETPILINATGPWIDEINHRFNLPSRYKISKISGIHIVIDGLLTPEPVFLQTDHHRIFFIIPENKANQTVIGTTERRETSETDEVHINEEDINYLLTHTNHFLTTPLKREDVIDSYIGVRPLIESKKSMVKTSREYQLDLHDFGQTQLLHVFGGKLTTHSSLAQKAINLLPLYKNKVNI